MGKTARLAAGYAVFGGCLACGPSVSTLLAQNRWSEAVCAVRDPRDVERAVPAVISATAARVQAHEIARADVPTVTDDAAGDLFTRYRLAVVTAHYAQPSEGSLSVVPSGGRPLDDRLESLTGERVAPGHDEMRPVWSPRFADSNRPDDVAVSVILAVVTGGISLVPGLLHTEQRSVYIPPSEHELMAVAPRATTLTTALRSSLSAEDLVRAYAFARTPAPETTSFDVTVRLPACEATAHYEGVVDAQWVRLTSLDPKRMSVSVYSREAGTVFTVPVAGRTVVSDNPRHPHQDPVVVSDEDPPVPARDHTAPEDEGHERTSLVEAGGGAFVGLYGLSLFSGWLGDAICNGSCKDHSYDLLYVPVVGPAIAAALPGVQQRTDGGFLATLLIADTVIQAGGVIVALIGMAWHEKVPVTKAWLQALSGVVRF